MTADPAGPEAPPPHGPAWLPAAILAFVVVAHLLLVVGVVRAAHTLEQDEIISQLAASGHLDDWQRAIDGGRPTGTWVPGSDLRAFLELDSHSSMAETRRNLTELDLHPPLYFWSLLGVRSAGVPILWSGPVVNLTAVLLAGVILYALLREELGGPLLAALGTAVFAFSPALVKATSFTRQYPLLMLTGVALIWVTTRLLRHDRLRWLLPALFAVALAGMLTVTQFAFALGGALLVVALRWCRTELRRVLSVAGTMVASGAAALVIHPGYSDQYDALNRMVGGAAPLSIPSRLRNWTNGFSSFVTLGPGSLRVLVVLGFVLAGLMILLLGWRTGPSGPVPVEGGADDRARSARLIDGNPVVAAALGVAGVALAGATIAYLLGRTPVHAAGARYVVFFWPGIVLVGAAIVRRWLARPALVLLVIASLLLIASGAWVKADSDDLAGQRHAVQVVQRASLVVADCLKRDYTPGAAMWAGRDTPFLLAARGNGPPPPVPAGADRTHAVLLHADDCAGQMVTDLDVFLHRLGFRRGARVGPIARVEVFRLEPA